MTPEEMDQIAELAATKALEKVYTEVGKSVVRKALWVIGAGALVLFAYLSGHGYFKP